MISKEWTRRAGIYTRAADAVRAADHDARVSNAEYVALIDARECAFAALTADESEARA